MKLWKVSSGFKIIETPDKVDCIELSDYYLVADTVDEARNKAILINSDYSQLECVGEGISFKTFKWYDPLPSIDDQW